jgi:Leucine-rich repeat (LRR) protein
MQLHLDGEGDGVELLSLYRAGLDEVPGSVWERRALVSLNLSCNRLRVLPERVRSLSRLRLLDLGHNELAELPAAVAALGRLEFLYVHDNRVRALPPLGALARLRYLNLGDNPLAALPELPELEELHADGLAPAALAAPAPPRSLRALSLRRCGLESPPAWLAELPRLERLDLRWNRLPAAPPSVPPGCRVLL